MSNVAFRFLGHMANRGSGIIRAAGQQNIPQLALETGLNVMELVGNIVSYNEAKKQTDYLHEQVENARAHNDRIVEIQQQNYEEKLLLLQQRIEEELRTEQKQLKFELQAYAQKLETQYSEDASIYEQNKKLIEVVNDTLHNLLGILDKAGQYLDTLTEEDKVRKQELFEEYRKIQKQVNQLVKTLY
ncbi:hypothetical protein SAMN05443252_101847 [Bacillus sp. OV322]|uniref:hypothetical protein n=1 Tax=Bacillus sp. OV322 TaxID=1882764 RepID=UPI0008E586AE|nr:hypothetical protein [Bacillus sp. OV322]SFC09364.1 hypothetical protein SAMN05443252_101847 [Bacillus sp. OV322]